MFSNNKYKVVKNVISSDVADLVCSSLLISEAQGKLDRDNGQVVGTSIVHGYGILDALMLKLLPVMQENTNLELLPTYSFARIYRKGDELVKHTDRPSCEVSTTLCLGFKSDKLWPIWVNSNGKDIPIDLEKGDMMIYRGCEVTHWREPFIEGNIWIQTFLHYVDAKGPYVEHILDKRPLKDKYEAIYANFLR